METSVNPLAPALQTAAIVGAALGVGGYIIVSSKSPLNSLPMTLLIGVVGAVASAALRAAFYYQVACLSIGGIAGLVIAGGNAQEAERIQQAFGGLLVGIALGYLIGVAGGSFAALEFKTLVIL